MTSPTILPHVSCLKQFIRRLGRVFRRRPRRETTPRPSPLNQDAASFPPFVRECPVAMRYWRLLSPLDWQCLPEREGYPQGLPSWVSIRAFVAACMIKVDRELGYMSHLRAFLVEHPALIWVLGFSLVPDVRFPWGFDPQASLPTPRHFTRLLRQRPNAHLQCLLDETVRLLQAELATEVDDFGHAISTDTKHILAWVRQNNPKDYVPDRFAKAKQPTGDPDCRLGCKRRRNQRASSKEPPPTPPDNPVPARDLAVSEFYWGYGSGVVGTKVPAWGEFVLAELTLPFDQPDVAYFFPLMDATERRLGFRPRFGAFDAAFDAWYVYAHFHRQGQQNLYQAFAAVPFSLRGGHRKSFDPQGLPLCQAGLPMPLRSTFWSKATLVPHQCGRYVCPLRFPEPSTDTCPIQHKNWPKGCVTTLPTSIGARIRYQLDRKSAIYKEIYKQRTATERLNSQAVALGIQRPKLRNGQAIANQNTLIYVLINLRALHRIRARKRARDQQSQIHS